MNPLIVASILVILLLFIVAFCLQVAPKHGNSCALGVFGLVSVPMVIYAMQQSSRAEAPPPEPTFAPSLADTVQPSGFSGGQDEPADDNELIRILETIDS